MSEANEEMVCDELVELVTQYLEQTLPELDRGQLIRHMDDCPWCRDYVDQHREIVDALGHLNDGVKDEAAWSGLLAALRERRGDTSA